MSVIALLKKLLRLERQAVVKSNGKVKPKKAKK